MGSVPIFYILFYILLYSLMDLKDALAYEAMMQDELVKTEDHREAVKAFLNKTKPVFKGR